MGSNDIPPSHVPSHVVPTYNLLLQIGGGLWTISYILYVRESFVSKSYGMPLFACALNFGWEIIFALIIAESPLERLVFASWVIIDCGIVVGIIKHAKYEWVHSPVVARNIGWLFGILVLGATMAHGTFAKWWLDNEIGRKEGKIFRGRLGPDVDELAWWGCVVCQSYSSMDGLRQLVVRHHSGGVSWSIWATRALGTIVGMYGVYAWEWYFWREAHEYAAYPFSLFMCGASFVCDCVYPYVLWRVQKTEKILSNGRKVAGCVFTPSVEGKGE